MKKRYFVMIFVFGFISIASFYYFFVLVWRRELYIRGIN